MELHKKENKKMMKKYSAIVLIACSSAGLWGTWDGLHYQLTSRPQYEMAQFALNQLPKKPYNSILDIGCGSGEVTKELADKASFVLGVDY